MRIRPQYQTRPSAPSVHPVHALDLAAVMLSKMPQFTGCGQQVWEEEVNLMEMHPNPVVLERLHAAGQLALSNERVLLSGLPVHVLVSVQRTSNEVCSYSVVRRVLCHANYTYVR